MKTFWVNGLNKMGIESGDYVLASEANERIKELENQLSPLSSATPSYVAGLNERIKVLETENKELFEIRELHWKRIKVLTEADKNIDELEAEVARLTALVQEHQTYQTKQGEK